MLTAEIWVIVQHYRFQGAPSDANDLLKLQLLLREKGAHIPEQRLIDIVLYESRFGHDGEYILQRRRTALEYVQLGPLNIDLDEIHEIEIVARSKVIETGRIDAADSFHPGDLHVVVPVQHFPIGFVQR